MIFLETLLLYSLPDAALNHAFLISGGAFLFSLRALSILLISMRSVIDCPPVISKGNGPSGGIVSILFSLSRMVSPKEVTVTECTRGFRAVKCTFISSTLAPKNVGYTANPKETETSNLGCDNCQRIHSPTITANSVTIPAAAPPPNAAQKTAMLFMLSGIMSNIPFQLVLADHRGAGTERQTLAYILLKSFAAPLTPALPPCVQPALLREPAPPADARP